MSSFQWLISFPYFSFDSVAVQWPSELLVPGQDAFNHASLRYQEEW